jgi:predicted transcriptional regulator
MPAGPHAALTRRERQIMDILYRRGRATAAEVIADLASAPPACSTTRRSTPRPWKPTSSTVRTQLRVLEEKGHVRHEEHGLRYIYLPAVPRSAARRSALRHLVETFFDGSAAKVVAAVLGGEATRVSDDELARISELVERASRKETP